VEGVERRIVGTNPDPGEEEALAASSTGVRTELYRDQFGVLLEDLDHQLLELTWLEGSASMTDDDFKAWLARAGPEIAAWRDEKVIPRYNRAGVTKFAFLLPEGSPGAGGSPALEPPGKFPTGYFDTPDKIEAWFTR